jgi:hypothetical protein
LGLVLFLRTAPPTIFLGDSGEIAAAAYNLGIPHPPGYPLDMLLGKISMSIPAGDMAFRMNILSSLFAVICFVFLYMAGVEFLNMIFKADADKPALKFSALLVSLIFLFSGVFWFEAIHAKGAVYTFANMLMSLSIFLVLKNFREWKNSRFYAAVYVMGFLLPAHDSTALFLAFSGALLLYTGRKRISMKKASAAAILFLLSAVTPYLYLFLRAGTLTPVNFGFLAAPGEVMAHIMRKSYITGHAVVFDAGEFTAKMGYCAWQFVEKYNILLLFLAAGLYYICTFSRKLSAFTAGFILLNTVALEHAINTSAGLPVNSMSAVSLYASRNFYLMNDLVPVLVSMAGVCLFIRTMAVKYGLNAVFAGGLLSAVLPMMITVNFGTNDFSRTFMGYDHALNVNKSLEKGDIIWAKGDCPVFDIAYMKSVKGAFKGVKTYDCSGSLLDPGALTREKTGSEKELFSAELKTYVENPGRVYCSASDMIADGIFPVSYGIIFKISPRADAPPGTEKISEIYAFRDYFNNKNMDVYNAGISAQYFLMRARYAAMGNNRALTGKWLKLAAETAVDSPEILNGMADVYYNGLGDLKAAILCEQSILAFDPDNTSSMRLLIDLNKHDAPLTAVKYLEELQRLTIDGNQKEMIAKEISGIKNQPGRTLEGIQKQ